MKAGANIMTPEEQAELRRAAMARRRELQQGPTAPFTAAPSACPRLALLPAFTPLTHTLRSHGEAHLLSLHLTHAG